MVAPSPHNLQLRAWIRDHVLSSPEFTTELNAQVAAALGTVLTTRGDLLTRDGTGSVRLAKGAQNTLLNMGANDPAWATLSTILDNILGSTRGALMYRGASGWAKLDPGASGFVLTSNGAGADPSYQDKSGSIKFISSRTASSSSSLDFTSGIDSTYANYEFVIENLVPSTNAVSFYVLFSTDAGTNWISSNYITSNGSTDTQIQLTPFGISNTAGSGLSGRATLYSPATGSTNTWIRLSGEYRLAVAPNAAGSTTNGGSNTTTSAVNGIRFIPSSGNISSGTIRMYGIKGS